MPNEQQIIDSNLQKEYEFGFVTDIESETLPPGLDDNTIRTISTKKEEPEWLLEWRLKAYRHWLNMEEPQWANVTYPKIDYQAISYFSQPKKKELSSLDEVDPDLLATYDKLGIPLEEQKMLSGVAVDAVFDSVSVATTFKEELKKAGVIFSSFSEAVKNHPGLIKKYLGSVVPYTDNYFATMNSAVFSDGSFVYVPPGVRCPIELMTYFRINQADSGQFERTLIIADEGSYVSYLEGCTAPARKTNQLHAAVVELVALDNAELFTYGYRGLAAQEPLQALLGQPLGIEMVTEVDPIMGRGIVRQVVVVYGFAKRPQIEGTITGSGQFIRVFERKLHPDGQDSPVAAVPDNLLRRLGGLGSRR